MSALPAEATHTLYRLFDESGELLYVGITSNPERRLHHHKHTKPWWSEVATVTFENHPTGDDVAAAEADAIESERPRYNVRPGKRTDVRIFRVPGVGKRPMVMRTIRVPASLWDDAKACASEEGANISDIVRELVEDYVRRGGKR